MESKAVSHFENYHYSNETKKKLYDLHFLQCNKVIIDNNNTTGKVSHLFACRPDKFANLSNKVKFTSIYLVN